jgi:hypothetical protein
LNSLTTKASKRDSGMSEIPTSSFVSPSES